MGSVDAAIGVERELLRDDEFEEDVEELLLLLLAWLLIDPTSLGILAKYELVGCFVDWLNKLLNVGLNCFDCDCF